jgi:hypothetical protein
MAGNELWDPPCRIAHHPTQGGPDVSNGVYPRAKSCQLYASFFSLIMRSAPQCHHHDDGGCSGQRGQPHVGQHVETPPP